MRRAFRQLSAVVATVPLRAALTGDLPGVDDRGISATRRKSLLMPDWLPRSFELSFVHRF